MKFGIIGTNFVSDFFMDGAVLIPECQVTAVCSRTMAGAERFAAKYNIPHVFDSYERMYAANVIDAVYVAVPNSLHLEVSLYFLSRKIPVFCEKPMAGNAAQVQEMIACAKEHGTYLQEGLVPLYSPYFEIIRSHLPQLGKIRQVNINMSQYSTRYDAYLRGENPTTFRNELCNGATMDLGVYVFAWCIALFGKPRQVLSGASLLDTGVDVSGSSILVYDGFTANLAYSKASDSGNAFEICGEKGRLVMNHPTRMNSILWEDRVTKARRELAQPIHPGFYYEIREMLDRVETGAEESTRVPLDLSMALHEVLTESRKQTGITYPCDQ